jgi:hypothetical protein
LHDLVLPQWTRFDHRAFLFRAQLRRKWRSCRLRANECLIRKAGLAIK